MALHDAMHQTDAPGRAQSVKKLTNFLGAAISVGLVVGIGIWGFKLLVRDVSGVPVIRAAEGPMRIQPEDPGGQQALNQGLSVNNVAAEGAAEDTADRLVLAPEPLELTLEDEPVTKLAEVEPLSATPDAEAGEPLPAETDLVQKAAVDAVIAQITREADPLAGYSPESATAAEIPAVPKVDGGIGRSLRPHLRPVSFSTAPSQNSAKATEAANMDASAIPAGTRLAQLGAYESAEVAQSEWERLSGKFEEYLDDKERVIQKATSGGRTFYRLRAMGFADLSDARRFCSALVAEKAECIPVVTR